MSKPTIIIRRAVASDAEAIKKIFEGPRVVWGTLQLPYPLVEKWEKWITEPSDSFFRFVACAENEVVGEFGLETYPTHPRRKHVGEIGMAVHEDWQGKGVGSAMMQTAVDLADKWLNLKRLELTVYVDNPPAIALYRKFGFEQEGLLRGYAFRDGAYVDAYMMARMRLSPMA